MRLGNVLAGIGIILGFVGLLYLPLWNLHELPYIADPSYPKGGGWIAIVQTGIFIRPGIFLIVIGALLYGIAKLLPKKYWKTTEELFDEEIKNGYIKKGTGKKRQ